MVEGAGLLVLAAGASQRMGAPKALLPFGVGSGETFLTHILAQAAAVGVRSAVVVLGPPHGGLIREALQGRSREVQVAWNDAPERGMLSSVQAGLPLLEAVAGALVWPVDMPFVQRSTVRCIMTAASQREVAAAAQREEFAAPLIIPTHDGRGGHPIWVPADLFKETLLLPTEEGLRALRRRHPGREARLPVADPAVLCDVDTREALAEAWQRLSEEK